MWLITGVSIESPKYIRCYIMYNIYTNLPYVLKCTWYWVRKKMSTYFKAYVLHNIMSSQLNVLLKIQCAIYTSISMDLFLINLFCLFKIGGNSDVLFSRDAPQIPQTGWLKFVYFLIVLDTKHVRSRCLQVCFFWGISPWYVDGCLISIITSLPLCTCVPISYSYKDIWKLYDYPL